MRLPGPAGGTKARFDAVAKVTGTARYTVDEVLPGMLYATVLRCPHPHARILRIDAEPARRLPGVVAVLTGADPEARRTYGPLIKDQPILAGEVARYSGDPVAAVAATDPATAGAALNKIDVSYQRLPAVPDIASALSPDAPDLRASYSAAVLPASGDGSGSVLHPARNVCYRFRYTMGDPAVFAACDEVFEDTFTNAAMQHYHLEPFVCLARVDDGGVIELWSGTQSPYGLRDQLANLFGQPPSRVRVHVPAVGGAFGAKHPCRAEPVAVLLALATRRPVRFCMTAAEAFRTQRQHAARITLRTGVRRDGTLVARHCDVQLDAGAYADASPSVTQKAAYRAPGPYRWQYVDTTGSCVLTTTTPAGPFRGFGAPQATWASESQIDMIAERLEIDPFELRMRNLRELGEPFMPGDSGIDSDLADGLTKVADAIGYHSRHTGTRRPGRGVGLAIGLKDAGGGRKRADARITVGRDGSVTLWCATIELGQGAHTTLRQLVADGLALRPEDVQLAPIDTGSAPFDQGTYASSSATVMGQAVQAATADVRRAVLRTLHRDPPPDGVLPADWRRRVRGQEFQGTGSFAQPGDPAAPLGARTAYWEPGWAGAEVDVDRDTGRVCVVRLVVCGDAGRAINPSLCHEQELGSAALGVAQALVEHLVNDGDGLVTQDPLSYRVLRFTDMPAELDCIIDEQGYGPGPFGAKGYGEGGMLAVAAAIGNAIADAVGSRVTDLPLTPERVLTALTRTPEKTGMVAME